MEQDPLFVHLTAPTIVYATPRSSTTWRFVVVALVLLIFCTLNLTCSRRSDISREYGAKRRGEKKAKQNKQKKKERKKREKKRNPNCIKSGLSQTIQVRLVTTVPF